MGHKESASLVHILSRALHCPKCTMVEAALKAQLQCTFGFALKVSFEVQVRLRN